MLSIGSVHLLNFSWKRNLIVLWLGCFLVSMAYSVSIPFLSIFLQDQLGIKSHLETWTGFIFAITFLFSSLIAPFWGSLADKYGRKPMMLRAGICLTLAYLAYFFVQTPFQLTGVRIIEGLLAGYIPSAISIVATNTPEKDVGYALGLISTSNATALIIGPLVGGFISQWVGTRNTFFLSAILVFVAFFIALLWVKEPNFRKKAEKRQSVAKDLKEALSNPRLMFILLIVFTTSLSIMIVEPLLTVYVLKLGSSKSSASMNSGIIFSIVGIATLLGAPLWGKIGARIGYNKVLFYGLLGGGIGNILQIMFNNLIGFGVLRFVYGLFFAAVFPALNALIVQMTEPEFRGRAFSLNQTANQLGLLIGPILGGVLANLLSIPIVFLINGFLLLCIAVIFKLKSIPASIENKKALHLSD
ncbi:MFS transporter [Paenibacillus sp. GP183]|uniref:MFS transporter n=1 Tax=Paenibacillus sp. GP183 TaxID=1882751 RepID=UPI000B860757|nr:MFS transporter [Paenibacillus sp. GP183]